MNNSAELTPSQPGLTASLGYDTPPGPGFSTYWHEISDKLQALSKEVATTLAARVSCLYILDQKRKRLVPYFSWGDSASSFNFTEQALGEGLVGQVGQSKRPVRIDDLKGNRRFKLSRLDFPHNAALAAPLLAVEDQQLVGVILVADKVAQSAFLAEDEQLLLSLVDRLEVALAIQKANLFREKPDWSQTLRTLNQISQTLNTSLHSMDVDEVCRTILLLPGLKDIFQFDVAEICLWDAPTKALTTALRLPDDGLNIQVNDRTYRLNEGYTGWIAANQKSLLIGDTWRFSDAAPKGGVSYFPYRSFMGAPLKIGAKFLGTLELAAAPINLYESADVAILEVVANQSAVAIDHARLFQEAQRNLSKLSLLFDASRELSSTLSYEELLGDLSGRLAYTFAADECVVYSFDETAGALTLIQQYTRPTPSQAEVTTAYLLDTFPLTVAKFPALQAALRAQTAFTVRSNDPEAGPHELEWLKQKNYGVMVAIPLISRDRVTGLVQLFSTNPHAFAEDDIWLAQSLVTQANIALENASLFSLTDQQLQKRVNELAGLQHVGSEINSTLDLNHILSIVLEEAIRVTQADFGNVNLYDAKTGKLVAYKEQGRSTRSHGRGKKSKRSLRTTSVTEGIMEQVLQTGKAILVPNVLEDEDYINLGGDEIRSKVVVPIFYGGEPAGVINLESKLFNFFNDDQLRYLEALANQAAVAIGNTQAYQEQKRQRERANRRADQLARLSEISNAFRTSRPLPEILEDIAYAISESVGYNVVLISLIEGQPPTIHHKVGAGIPVAQLETLCNSAQPQPLANLQALMQEEFCLSKSYFIPVERAEIWQDKLDVPRIEVSRYTQRILSEAETLAVGLPLEKENPWQLGDVLFVPLTNTDGQIIGLLTVENPDSGERPDILLVQTLEIFANQAAVAIENARLFEVEQQRRRLADTLRDVAGAVSSQLDFDELLNVVLQELAKVVHYDSSSVQLLKEDQLVITGGRGWPDNQQVIGLSFSMAGDNPSRVVVETQEPLLISDVQLAYPMAFADPPHDRIRSWLGVPLTYGTNVIGLMTVDSTLIGFFTREDANVLLLFANQVAVAWQNARLFEEARQQVRQLAALTEVAQSLNRALNLNEILNLVLDAVFDLVGQSQGSIWLIDHSTHTVKIAETKNVPSFLVELFNESAISVDSEPFASVIKSGHELVIKGSTARDDIANYGLPFPDDVTYVPLKTEAGVIGILAIETVIRDKNMLQLVTTLADLAAVAIEGARLLEDTRQRANEMQYLYRLGVEVSGLLDVRQVMVSVINDALTLTQTQIGAIVFWDEERKGYIVEGALNTTESVAQLILNEAKESLNANTFGENGGALWSDLTQQIMSSGQPLIVNPSLPAAESSTVPKSEEINAQPALKRALPLGIRAMLGVPIQVQNQANGAIFVCALTLRNFNEHDVQLLAFVSNQTAVAVRNAQLVHRLNLFTEELERRVALRTEELAKTLDDLTEERDRVESLYQITRELSVSFDLDRVLVEALSLINRAVGISQGSILLFDPETGRLIYRAALGRDRPLPRGGLVTAYRPGYGLAGKIVESRQPRLVPDLLEEPEWVVRKDNPDRRSALGVPLITGEDVLGVLLLFHPEPDYFTEDHQKLVTAAGAQIATAINNAELYRLITDQAQRLGVMLRTQAAEATKNQAILRGITDGVLVLDAKRDIVLVNPKAAEILDVDAAALENRSIHQSLGQAQAAEGAELTHLFYQNLLRSLTVIEAGERSAEFRIEVGKRAVAVSLAPVALGADDVPSVIAVLRDISREAEIDRLKNEFISTVSHELRTPMTSIKGYADLLVSDSSQIGELNPIQHRFVQIIQSNANRLAELVNDILEISRIETGRVKLEFESLDVIRVIKEVAVSFEGQMVQKAMNLSLNLPDDLPNVYADRARVIQILVNLIGNAWQYTPEGGNIIVHAQVVDENFVQIDVVDNGIGIVEQDLHFIFDRFFRSERTEVQVVDGTGLGLSITRMFVEMLGGKIWVKSHLDVGSTFSFTLPIDIDSPSEILQISLQPDIAQMLIIDDNSAIVDLLKPRLEEAGYQVVVTAEADKALSLAHQADGALRLIILSLLLKNADSFSLLEKLKQDEATTHIPVLLSSLSATGKGQDLSFVIDDYIATTFEEAQVLESVKLALTSRENDSEVELTSSGATPLPKRNPLDRILVVGDNRESVKWLKNTLDAGGYKVQRAFNSQQALEVAAGSKPDLILIDTKMSVMNGETIIAQLRQILEPENVPIIVVTDRSVPPKVDSMIKMLGRESWVRLKQALPVDDLVAEIVRVGGKFAVGATE
jgi:GAF domain-containing protein/DNA-binding response OmpR family regulator